jgi:large subunit ribosomal protein L17
MRHKNNFRKLSRRTAHRTSLLRNLVKSLIKYGRIKTTVPKAKEMRSVVEKLVTTAKNNTLHARRLVIAKLGGPYKEVNSLFTQVVPKLMERKGVSPYRTSNSGRLWTDRIY